MSTINQLFDTHCHLFEHGFTGPNGVRFQRSGEELLAYQTWREEAGIRRSLVVGYDEDQYEGNSDYISDLAVSREWISPLRYAPVGADVPAHASIYPGGKGGAQQVGQVLLKQAREERAPRVVSLNATPEAVAILAPVIRELNTTWFLLSHMGLPGPVGGLEVAREVLGPVLSLAGAPNVSVKISGQYAATAGEYPHLDVLPLVDVLAEGMGIEALVWGSDFSPSLDFVTGEQAINCVLPSNLDEASRHAIYFQNAADKFERFWGTEA